MSYKVKLDPKVQKFLEKLEKKIAERVRTKLQVLKANPFSHLEHYESEDCYKFRIGNYRALIDIDTSRNIISSEF